MACANPFFVKSKDGVHREVDCGRCTSCRISRAAMWSLRIVHEASQWKENSFATLTYDEEHYPSDGNLEKMELVKFFKRLRRNIPGRLRFYAAIVTGKPHEQS